MNGNNYLAEAFKKMELLDEDVFPVSDDGVEKLKAFLDGDALDNSITIIDTEAEDDEELKDDYVGQVILDCTVCHSKIYCDKDKITVGEDDEVVNVGEECPFCYADDGYTIVGEVAEFDTDDLDDDADEEHKDEEEKADEKEVEESAEKDDEVVKVHSKSKMLSHEKEDKSEVADPRHPVQVGLRGRTNKLESLDETSKETVVTESDDRKERLRARVKKLMGNKEAVKADEACKCEKKLDEAKKQVIVPMGSEREFGKLLKKYNCKHLEGLKGRQFVVGEPDAVESFMAEWAKVNESCKCNKAVKEAFKDVSITTDDSHMEMTSDEDGKVTVTTEPIHEEESKEVVAPVSMETKEEIIDKVEDEDEGEETIDFDFDEVDDEEINEIGESYLKNVYNNVESFRVSDINADGDKLMIEGLIKFTSGNTRKTNFVFEAKDATKSGKVRFIGENKQIGNKKNAFILSGKVEGNKFLPESLNYNYRVKDSEGKTKRVYGTARR